MATNNSDHVSKFLIIEDLEILWILLSIASIFGFVFLASYLYAVIRNIWLRRRPQPQPAPPFDFGNDWVDPINQHGTELQPPQTALLRRHSDRYPAAPRYEEFHKDASLPHGAKTEQRGGYLNSTQLFSFNPLRLRSLPPNYTSISTICYIEQAHIHITMPVRFKWREYRDRVRRLKTKYLYKHGGPPEPSKDADLYFDWRRLREKPKQDHHNVHPGNEVYGKGDLE
ncbi:hypothetical protein CC86DRAFT_413941 [Ophiobolus disseminans]|uniref:Uncharacterized protein n=1 Tax=Ophiobolus disseminans TaxID=1469910 RepID=A0A6A6ZBE9_9PLEO|nr:hypothetical protein CC86DRAFT_413941 [Ophiobolus disseminans]